MPPPHEQPWHTRAANLPIPGDWGYLVDQFLDSCNFTLCTTYYYKRILSKLALVHPGTNPADLTRMDLTVFLSSSTKGKSASTKATATTVIKRFYCWLEEMGLATSDPAKWLKRPTKPRPEPRYLDPEDVTVLLRTISASKDYAFLSAAALAAYAGLRRGSIHSLKWEDVNLEARTITVRHAKGGKHNTIPMANKLYCILATWKQASATNDSGYVYAHIWRGEWRPLYYTSSGARLKTYAKKAGLSPDVTMHDLRRTFATTLHRAKVDIAVVSRLLGHADVSTTMNHYAFTADAQKRDAIDNLVY